MWQGPSPSPPAPLPRGRGRGEKNWSRRVDDNPRSGLATFAPFAARREPVGARAEARQRIRSRTVRPAREVFIQQRRDLMVPDDTEGFLIQVRDHEVTMADLHGRAEVGTQASVE